MRAVFHANLLHVWPEKMSRSRCSTLSGTETIRGMCEHLLTKKNLFARLVVFVNL